MARYVAFLRGMNLGGRRITNEDLRGHFEALGCGNVATFRASGNVILSADEGSEARLTTLLEDGLGERLGYAAPVFLRTAGELHAIAAREPFAARHYERSKGKLQIAMLSKKPSAPEAKQALTFATDDDRLAVEGRELYWLPAGGMSESDLDLKALESILGLITIRTKGTIEQIAAKYLD